MISLDRYQGPKAPQYIEATLQPGQSAPLDGVAAAFYVVSATGPVRIRTSIGQARDFLARQGEEAHPSNLFERIEVSNATAGAITVTVYYGWGRFIDGVPEDLGSVTISGTPTVIATEKQSAAAPDNELVDTANGTVFTLASGERGFIQNLGTAPLKVRRAAAAGAAAFHFVLPGGSVADDGEGGSVWIDDHIGDVSVFSTGPRFIAWKI